MIDIYGLAKTTHLIRNGDIFEYPVEDVPDIHIQKIHFKPQKTSSTFLTKRIPDASKTNQTTTTLTAKKSLLRYKTRETTTVFTTRRTNNFKTSDSLESYKTKKIKNFETNKEISEHETKRKKENLKTTAESISNFSTED